MTEERSETVANDTIINKFRNWLTINKVFFETIAASLLSLMAIILSIAQIIISNKQTDLNVIQTEVAKKQLVLTSKQTDLTSIQTEIAQQQLTMAKQQARIQQSAAWGELRNAMWEIMDQYPPSGTNALNSLSVDQKVEWLRKIRTILDSQIKNPVLIQNKECLGYWRNAISSANSGADILDKTDMSTMADFFLSNANSILKDTLYVWESIILKSNEVSATGGLPQKGKSRRPKSQIDRK